MGKERTISPAQARAARLAAHHLDRRVPTDGLIDVVAVVPVPDYPPGAAGQALAARIDALGSEDFESVLVNDRAAVAAWTVRGTTHVVAADQHARWTEAFLPHGDDAWPDLLEPHLADLAEAGIDPAEALTELRDAGWDALDGRTVAKGDLATEVAGRVRSDLFVWCQRCDAHHPHDLLYRMAIGQGRVACIADGSGRSPIFARTDQWLGSRPPRVKVDRLRAAVVRVYLYAYGPSTPGHLAEWAGVAPALARRMWSLVDDELVPVTVGGRDAWSHTDDMAMVADPPKVTGARLLPAGDPFLQQRDRSTLVADKERRQALWRAVGSPGALLVDGVVKGVWRARKQDRRLEVTVEPFGRLAAKARRALETEAERLAPIRGCSSSSLKVGSA